MKRLSDEAFVGMQKGSYDKIIAIRIEDGDFYFLGWMEDAENYAIQIPVNSYSCMLDRDAVVGCGDIISAIESCDGYNNILYDWEMDSSGNVLHGANEKYLNAYDCFLSYVNCYEKDGLSDPDDHDIFCLNADEFNNIIDALRNGDYIFVLDDQIAE